MPPTPPSPTGSGSELDTKAEDVLDPEDEVSEWDPIEQDPDYVRPDSATPSSPESPGSNASHESFEDMIESQEAKNQRIQKLENENHHVLQSKNS